MTLLLSRTRLYFEDDVQNDAFENIFNLGSPIQPESEISDIGPDRKRRRTGSCSEEFVSFTDTSVDDIITAVDRLSTNADLVADGSRGNTLPTISGKHKDLKAISPQTVGVK